MDRLTKWMGDHAAVVNNHANYINRLAAYEDTGLEPEEIQGLCEMDKRSRMAQMLRWEQAEAEGRLLILPCKVGDTVYVIGWKYRAGRYETWVNTGKFRPSDLEKMGKTVFLTREEAEAALEREKQ